MKLKNLLLASCLLCSTVFDVYGQLIPRSYYPSPLLPIAQGGKMGYIDHDGKVVIEPQFSLPSFMGQKLLTGFRDGLALIKEHGKWGYIDLTGKVVIQPKYDEAWAFKEGVALVLIGDKWGYINKSGEFIWGPTK